MINLNADSKVFVLALGEEPRQFFVDRQKALDEAIHVYGDVNSDIYVKDDGAIMQQHLGFAQPHRRGRIWEEKLGKIIIF